MLTRDLILRTERDTLKFRLLALAVVALITYYRQDQVPILPAVFWLLIYLAYNLSLSTVILPRWASSYTIYGMLFVDTAFLTGALYLIGAGTALFLFLPMAVIYYSIYQGYITSLLAASLLSLGYVGVTVIEGWADYSGPVIATQVPLLYLLAILSGYLAARRLEERREKDELQELLRLSDRARDILAVAQNVGKSLELEFVLREAVDSSRRALSFEHSLLALLDGEGKRLVAQATNIPPLALGVSRLEELVVDLEKEPTARQVLEKNEAINMEATPWPPWVASLEARSLLLVPLVSKGKKVGLLYLIGKQEPGTITASERQMARGYGETLANAIVNADLHQKTQRKLSQLVHGLESAVERIDHLAGPARRRDLVVGDLHLDGPRGQAYLGNRLVNLSPTEFDVLYLLAENAGQALNEETILHRVWGEDYLGPGNVVDVTIHRLRRKIDKSRPPERLITVRGAGYMLVPRVAAATSPERPSHP